MKLKNIDKKKLTPMMKQYARIKEDNQDKILFYRLGDFYEVFFEDAIIVSKELELVLTGKDCGLDERAPMAGIPHHSSTTYMNRMVEKGYKIAVAEQIEDPKLAKGIVERAVVKIISPGTLLNLEGQSKNNNFLASVYLDNDSFGVSYIDITTGEFNTTETINSVNPERNLIDFLVKINPKEILINKEICFKSFNDYVTSNKIYITKIDSILNIKEGNQLIKRKVRFYDENFYKNKIFSVLASSMLLDYIYLYRKENLNHLNEIKYVNSENFMKIDANTRDNLEIHKSLNDNSLKNTLFYILDKANTAMGSRKINSWLEFPLINKKLINQRLDIVDYLHINTSIRNAISDILSNIYDLERILSKISFQNANTKDLIILKNSLEYLPMFLNLLKNTNKDIFQNYINKFDALEDIYALIDKSIKEDGATTITEGGIIKDGYNTELDKLRKSAIEGNKELIDYEKSERERTGVSKLKISFNKNTGYYIELTKSVVDKAPDNYIRRQTLKNSERYVTDELNLIADKIINSENNTMDLEYKIFCEIRDTIAKNAYRIKQSTDTISSIDALNSFANVSSSYSYTRPIFNDENYISINDGRHPVVEASLGRHQFISNDTKIGKNNTIIQIITGPNMAGKSTYMRQVSLILLMAQIGSFVPASSCDISISDAIFTRIGASDNLAKGDSTFMVEMKEMSNIVENATKNSFVILDEVGRGTSTNDGYSIAKSIIEYISKNINCKTLFATHYHELTDLEETLTNVENLKVLIEEENDEMIFLRKIVKGKTDKSYGIEVAKLSGLPEEIIFRANTILNSLNDNKLEENKQLSLLHKNNNSNNIKTDIILKELGELNINNLTPILALETLSKFQKKVKDLLDD